MHAAATRAIDGRFTRLGVSIPGDIAKLDHRVRSADGRKPESRKEVVPGGPASLGTGAQATCLTGGEPRVTDVSTMPHSPLNHGGPPCLS
jgi:hypothetical protein